MKRRQHGLRIHDPMLLNRTASGIFLALASFTLGCKQMPPPAATQQVAARAVPASVSAQTSAPQRETPLPNTRQAGQAAASPADQPNVEDFEDRKGPFTIKGQTFTIVQHLKVQKGEPDATLALMEIVDSSGVVGYRDDFAYAVENGGFCGPASVKVISGSNGAGFLLDMACAASQPDGGGPSQILSVNNGKSRRSGSRLPHQAKWVISFPARSRKLATSPKSCQTS